MARSLLAAILGFIALAVSLSSSRPAEAVTDPIYTLPFFSQYIKTCGFGCYSGHLGTDYQLGNLSAGGECTTDSIVGRPDVDRIFEAAEHCRQAIGQILGRALHQKVRRRQPRRAPLARAHEFAVENDGRRRDHFLQYHVRLRSGSGIRRSPLDTTVPTPAIARIELPALRR